MPWGDFLIQGPQQKFYAAQGLFHRSKYYIGLGKHHLWSAKAGMRRCGDAGGLFAVGIALGHEKFAVVLNIKVPHEADLLFRQLGLGTASRWIR